MYYLYILENQDRRHYIGITTDSRRRLIEHNKGSTKSTRPFRPWRVIYTERFKSRKDVCKREWHLKHPKGYKEKIEIIKKFGEVA